MRAIKQACVAIVLASSTSANASLIGSSVDIWIGVNFDGGPYDTGYFDQAHIGSFTVGDDVEYIDTSNRSADFGASYGHVEINMWALPLPFNGYTYTFDQATVNITDVILRDTNLIGFDQSHIFFNANQISLDFDNTNVGYINFDVVTSAVVPVPAAVWLFCSGLIGLFSFPRTKHKNS